MDQCYGQIHFAFQLINIALQPLHFITRFNAYPPCCGNRIIKSKHAVQTNHANLHALFFDDGIRLIPEHFAAVLVKDIALNNREFCLAELQQRVVPAMIELMIAHRNGIKVHGVHNIDDGFTLGHTADVRPRKVITRIKKPGRFIAGLFLFNHRRDIRPTANITCAIGNPRYLIRFNVGMEIVGVDDRDIFGTRPERQRDQNADSKHF